MMDWHREICNEEAEIRAKGFYAQQQKYGQRWNISNCDLSKRPWCGALAEEVLNGWLEDRIDWHEWGHDPDRFEKHDFYVPPWYIDSKCIAATTEPRLNYGCNVKKTQIKNVAVNAFVFSRYLWPEKEMIILGAISKKDFREIAIEREKGDIINQMTVEEPFLECSISDLTSLEEFLAGQPCLNCEHWNGYMDGQLCGPCWMEARRAS